MDHWPHTASQVANKSCLRWRVSLLNLLFVELRAPHPPPEIRNSVKPDSGPPRFRSDINYEVPQPASFYGIAIVAPGRSRPSPLCYERQPNGGGRSTRVEYQRALAVRHPIQSSYLRVGQFLRATEDQVQYFAFSGCAASWYHQHTKCQV